MLKNRKLFCSVEDKKIAFLASASLFLFFGKRSDRLLSRMITYIDASVSIIGLLITVIFFLKFRMKKAEFQTFTSFRFSVLC